MRSVADHLRRDTRAGLLALPPMARLAAALRLGDDDVTFFAACAGLDPVEARRRLRARRLRGRRPSRAAGTPGDHAADARR